MQKFYKGRTNNHLAWVMVDATDFATPESALSAATKIKIYGKLRGATGVNFVSSGTGSLTNDIVHVGASALGLYAIALAKADLSDASAAWYDQYIISLSATGAAYQALVIDGGIDDSYVSNVVSYLSNVVSYLSNMQSNLSGVASDVYSGIVALSDATSNAYSAAVVGASRILLVQSRLSDLDSRLASELSDTLSAVRGNSDALSDLLSRLNSASFLSDIASHVWAAKYTAHSAASSFGSLMSDIYSRVALTQSAASDAASAAAQGNSRVLLVQSRLSDLDSRLASDTSDILSALVALSDAVSNAYSAAVAGGTASDVASKVWAEKYTAASNVKASTFGSALRLNMSRISDTQSYLVGMSGMLSDAHSAAILAASTASEAQSNALLILSRLSDLDSRLVSDVSDMRSALSDFQSDFQSRVPKRVATDSQVSDLDSNVRSILTVMSGVLSDTYSAVSNVNSVVAARLPEGIQRNTALSNFEFLMVDSTDHVTPETGLTITATRSIDGAAFAATANAATEVSNGIYQINLAASDLNGTIVTFRFTATGADDRFVTIKTGP